MSTGTAATVIFFLLTLVLAIPLTWFGNITTPLFHGWLVRRSKSSLDRKIAKLQKELSELETIPEITEAEDEILWSIKSVKIFIIRKYYSSSWPSISDSCT